jgi:hypothetical protein
MPVMIATANAPVVFYVAAQQFHLTLVFLQTSAIHLDLRAVLPELPLVGLELELVLLDAFPQRLHFLFILPSVYIGAWSRRNRSWRVLSPGGEASGAKRQQARGEKRTKPVLKVSVHRASAGAIILELLNTSEGMKLRHAAN